MKRNLDALLQLPKVHLSLLFFFIFEHTLYGATGPLHNALSSNKRYVDASVLQRILRDHHGDVLAHVLLRDAGAFNGGNSDSGSSSSMKASQARLQVPPA